MPVTTPDSIYYSDTATPLDINVISAAEASSVQAALALRQRFEFVWANAAGRTGQLNMVTGSTGYQVDTKTEYIYESGVWRLKTPHAEFTASVGGYTSGAVTMMGAFSIDSAASTSSVFVTPGASGILIVADPGVYAISSVNASVLTATPTTASAVTGRSFLDLSKVSSAADQQRVSIVTGEDRGSLAKPNLRTTASNTNLYFQFFITNSNAANATLNSRVAITRIG